MDQVLAPPRSLVHLDKARQTFGESKVNLLVTLTQTGDALADALLQELEELGPDAARKLAIGLNQGLQMVDTPPPALQAFLESVEHIPDWVDMERVRRGSEAYLSIGSLWTIFALGLGSLTHTYSSPSIASILVNTGNLTKMAFRRLGETGVWNTESHLPGGLLRGANGYTHNLQVRLLHARVRRTLLKRDWDLSAVGLPINQLEMTRTWLDFTYVPFRALGAFGITFSRQELDDLYHHWQYIAYLLGIDERLYLETTNQERAQELLALISSTEEAPNANSRALEQAMLQSLAEFFHQNMKVPTGLAFSLLTAITRRLHGNALGDQLGLKRTWLGVFLPLVALGNRLRRVWNNRSPAARQRALERSTAGFRNDLAQIIGLTTYQRNTQNPDQQQLPETIEVEAAS